MSHIEGVVFDVDGTIIDTFEHIVQAFEVVLPEHGVTSDRAAITAVIGQTLHQCYELLHPDGDQERMTARHHEVQQTPDLHNLITVYDGFLDMLEKVAHSGLKHAVLTNRSRDSLDLIFDHLDLQEKFDVIVTPQDVRVPKPNPEGLELVAQRLAIPVTQLAIVGDTAIDIETGKNADVAMTIGVTHGFGSRESLNTAQADHIINHFDELPAVLGIG